jgi:hypothetical protein
MQIAVIKRYAVVDVNEAEKTLIGLTEGTGSK